MSESTATTADAGKTTYTYSAVVEPDEDAWHAYCPALQSYGAAGHDARRGAPAHPGDVEGRAGTLVSVTV